MDPVPFVGDPTKIKMGPASVTFKPAGVGATAINLGYTLNDSVSFNVTMNTTPVQPDQSSTPVLEPITSVEPVIDMELADCSADKLKLLPGGDATGLKDPIGVNLRDHAGELILVPLDENDTRVFRFPAAAPLLNGAMSFMRETPSALPIQFKCYKDSSDYYLYFALATP